MIDPFHKNTPADDDVAAVNLHKIRFAKDSVKVANQYFKEVQTHAEAKGIHLKAAKKAFAIIESGDADAWLQETSKITTYLRILRHGVRDGQLSLDLESNLAPIDEKAELDGRSAGLDVSPNATEAENPHDISTVAGQAWLRGFRNGRTERDIILSMKMEEDETETEGEEE
jgi:hypothetical protein